MTTPARQHRDRILARQAAEAAADNPVAAEVAESDPATREAALMLIRFTEDRRRLKLIQSREGKIAAKREMLPEYQAWLAGLVDAADHLAEGEPNDVLTGCMMWRIDIGDFTGALDLATVVLDRKIPLPAWYNRTPGCAIAEEITDAVFAALRSGTDFEPAILNITMALVATEDMPDEVRAKLFKADAMMLERQIDRLDAETGSDAGGVGADGVAGTYAAYLSSARTSAARAVALHPACGVKKLIEKLDRLDRKLAEKNAPASGTA